VLVVLIMLPPRCSHFGLGTAIDRNQSAPCERKRAIDRGNTVNEITQRILAGSNLDEILPLVAQRARRLQRCSSRSAAEGAKNGSGVGNLSVHAQMEQTKGTNAPTPHPKLDGD